MLNENSLKKDPGKRHVISFTTGSLILREFKEMKFICRPTK